MCPVHIRGHVMVILEGFNFHMNFDAELHFGAQWNLLVQHPHVTDKESKSRKRVTDFSRLIHRRSDSKINNFSILVLDLFPNG